MSVRSVSTLYDGLLRDNVLDTDSLEVAGFWADLPTVQPCLLLPPWIDMLRREPTRIELKPDDKDEVRE